jgi:hypothetical protein
VLGLLLLPTCGMLLSLPSSPSSLSSSSSPLNISGNGDVARGGTQDQGHNSQAPSLQTTPLFLAAWYSVFATTTELHLPAPPLHPEPIVVRYAQHRMQQMINLRSQFYSSHSLRPLVRSNWIGNAFVESFLSMCLPSSAYNSISLRKMLFVAMHYLVPLYSVARGMGAMLPHMSTFYNILRADVGVSVMSRMCEHFYTFYCTQVVRALCVRCVSYLRSFHLLPSGGAVLQQLAEWWWLQLDKFPLISKALRGGVGCISFVVKKSNYFIFNYILPNNVYLEYLRSQILVVQVGAVLTVMKMLFSAVLSLVFSFFQFQSNRIY